MSLRIFAIVKERTLNLLEYTYYQPKKDKMKTPEMYLEESKGLLARSLNYKNWHEFATSDYYTKTAIDYSAVAAHNALKSLNDDRDKELIAFARFIEEKNMNEGNEVLKELGHEPSLKPCDPNELLTQFRNRKQ
jgi:hypothetical protein